MYVNVGAKLHGSDIPTKAALKRAVAENPASVELYSTSLIPAGLPQGKQFVTEVINLDSSHKYSVTGPNPYTSRKWYATVEFNTKRNIWTVS